MMRKKRGAIVVAIAAGVALLATGCSANSNGGSGNGKVTLTFWQNSTTGPGVQFWKTTIKDFEKSHKNITINMQSIQNEDLDGKLQTALNSGSAPDIFLQRGGGKMAAMQKAGQLMDLTSLVTAKTKAAVGSGAFAAEQLRARRTRCPSMCFRKASTTARPSSPLRASPGRRRRSMSSTPTSRSSRRAASRRWPLGRRTPGPPVTGTTTSRFASAARTP